jgi:hypothetical protein
MPGALPFDILSPSSGQSRVGFERIPQNLTRTELFRYFTFSVEDRHEILECRGDHNRIGFALLLGGVRLTGRFPTIWRPFPNWVFLTKTAKGQFVSKPGSGRDNLVVASTQAVHHMQKALFEMNVQLSNVISDIVGETGLNILEAIVAGQKSPRQLPPCAVHGLRHHAKRWPKVCMAIGTGHCPLP